MYSINHYNNNIHIGSLSQGYHRGCKTSFSVTGRCSELITVLNVDHQLCIFCRHGSNVMPNDMSGSGIILDWK